MQNVINKQIENPLKTLLRDAKMAAAAGAKYEQPINIIEDMANLDETSADVETLTHEIRHDTQKEMAAKLVNRFTSFKEDLEHSFERERSGMEEYFENEKSDLVKGFMLEKKVLNMDHDAEKKNLIKAFVTERQKMMKNFHSQVKDIKSKLKNRRTSDSSRSTPSEVKISNEKNESSTSKLLIRVDGNRIITPQEFLATLELEEKFESEKEIIQKSFRKERDNMKNKLENDYEQKMLREKEKHVGEIKELHNDLEHLKSLKMEVGTMWKQQAAKLEAEFQKERNELEKHYREGRENLCKKLEDRNDSQLRKQQQEYDKSIGELKCELKRIKNDAKRQEYSICEDPHTKQENAIDELRQLFNRETKIIREQNEKFSETVKELTTEKYQLNQKMREMEINMANGAKKFEAETEKITKEHETKTRKLMSQIDRLKMSLNECEKQKQNFFQKAKTNKTDHNNIEERLEMTERTVHECEDTIIGMRIENTNLSHEINLLRNEKDDLLRIIDKYKEGDRQLKTDVTKLETDVQDLSGRYALLEREKLQQEKLITKLRMDLESAVLVNNNHDAKVNNHDTELSHLRQLLAGEKKENKRLHARFTQDAELIRKKDSENHNMRTQLDNIKTEFENLKLKIDSDNEKVLKMADEKQALVQEMERVKNIDDLHRKHDIVTVQNQYVKEFSKRLEYVKTHYEREMKYLRNQIDVLKNKKPPPLSTNIEQCPPPLSTNIEQCTCQPNTRSKQSQSINNSTSFEPSNMTSPQSKKHWEQITDFSTFSHSKKQGDKDYLFEKPSKTTHSSQPGENGSSKLQPLSTGEQDLSNVTNFLSSTKPIPSTRLKGNNFEENLEPTKLSQDSKYDSNVNSNNYQNVLNHSDQASAFQSVYTKSAIPYSIHKNVKLDDETYGRRMKSWDTCQDKPNNKHAHVKHGTAASYTSPQLPAAFNNWNMETGSTGSEQSIDQLVNRVKSAESTSDNEELRKLLKDVRKEVLLLNKMIDENTPDSTPRYSPLTRSPKLQASAKNKRAETAGNNINVIELKSRLLTTESEMNESKETMRRLFEENTELQQRVKQQQEEIKTQGTSCDEIVRRRIMLEKLVDRLQNKLREETCRRRQLEQEQNVINEESREEDLDDSTV